MANVKSQILNPITGRAKFNFLDDGTLCDAITGRTVGVIVGDQLISAITGETIASVVSDNNGNIDLSFITATAEDILKGKVGADVNGKPIEGTLVPQSPGSVEYYKCDSVEESTWNGYKAVLVEETVTTEGETVVVVSGAASMPAANGTYRQSNTETGQSAIYTSEDGQFRLFMEEVMYGHWCIMKGENNYDGVYYSQRSGTNPWDSNTTDWTYESSDIMNEYPTGKPESLTVTQETLEGTTETKKYYTFEERLTYGLTYGYGFTPEVGKVYDAEAMIKATFYEKAKLPEALYRTDFSNLSDFTLEGTVTSNVDASGRKFANFNKGRLSFEMPALPQSNTSWTIAFGVRNLQNYGDGVCFFNGGVMPGYDGLVFTGVDNSDGGIFVWGWSGDRLTCPTSILNQSTWIRVLITYDGSTAAIYLNGVKDVEGQLYMNIRGTTCAFGGSFWGSYNLKADLADFRVWGLAFNQEQVAVDYEEFLNV